MIGAGASPLVSELMGAGFAVVAVDISAAAIETLRSTLEPGVLVEYIVADIRNLRLVQPVDAWHDRAVFHFLVEPSDQRAYVESARATLALGGNLVIATFAPDGPDRCSGLPVARHDAASLQQCFGAGFSLVESFELDHQTPSGSLQRFSHAVLQRTDS